MAMSMESVPHFPPTGTNDHHSASHSSPLKTRVCRYFSKSGSCRAGSSCPFLHDDTRLPGAKITKKQGDDEGVAVAEASGSEVVITEDGTIQDRQQATNQVLPSRVVTKPIPEAQTQDPREFQLGQIRRRFSPKESRNGSATVLTLSLVPSDPDFPFEIAALLCSISVPEEYPKDAPSLKVGNKDIPRGFAINVEAGFDSLLQENRNSTLLELMKALDKHLENFLSAPKADTVKLVANKDIRHLTAVPTRAVEPVIAPSEVIKSTLGSIQIPAKPVIHFTAEQKAGAAERREVETRQLEARMGRLSLYKKSGDGIAYSIPVEPRRRSALPIALQAVKSVQLFVPLLYPLQPCRIQLEGVDPEETKPVQVGFENKATEQKETTLMGHINYLVQNMHSLANTVVEPTPVPPSQLSQASEEVAGDIGKGRQPEGQQDPDRSHIQYIARPPEWAVVDVGEGGSDYESDDDYSYDSGDESDDASGGVGLELENPSEAAPAQNAERGTAVLFPFMELYGIELLEVSVLNITVKCERCKDITEVKGLKSGIVKNESCRKCASPFSICFRSEFVHAHAVRAGFLDLDGCVVSDMLPSTFVPTCSECSTAYPLPGIVSVQGESTTNVCRECHKKFTFKLPQVKFLRISTTSHLQPTSGPRRKKETLGLTPGTELPKRGRCRHYTKSYRWFRFSCCQKVYACDKCHDEGEDHPNEWANRMICGWCSREGNYRPEDCGFCHGVLVGKRSGGGFWEGGKGTRDKVKMSRKDKRKYRRPGAAVKKT